MRQRKDNTVAYKCHTIRSFAVALSYQPTPPTPQFRSHGSTACMLGRGSCSTFSAPPVEQTPGPRVPINSTQPKKATDCAAMALLRLPRRERPVKAVYRLHQNNIGWPKGAHPPKSSEPPCAPLAKCVGPRGLVGTTDALGSTPSAMPPQTAGSGP